MDLERTAAHKALKNDGLFIYLFVYTLFNVDNLQLLQ